MYYLYTIKQTQIMNIITLRLLAAVPVFIMLIGMIYTSPNNEKPKAAPKPKTPAPPVEPSNVITYGRYTNTIKSPYKY